LCQLLKTSSRLLRDRVFGSSIPYDSKCPPENLRIYMHARRESERKKRERERERETESVFGMSERKRSWARQALMIARASLRIYAYT
jgi:hypothetical protein